MGRRSFGLTATQINRMISTSNAAAKQRERMNLINSQIGIQTEKEPEYEILILTLILNQEYACLFFRNKHV